VVLSGVQSAGSIHSVAEALLTLIDSFAEPVIPHQFYVRCIEACANETLCKQVSVGSTVFTIASLSSRHPPPPPPPQLFYGPFSGTTRASQCQKRTSGLYGARED